MTKSSLYYKLLNAPTQTPVFFTPCLKTDFLLQAYRFGLFPWTSQPASWWCPDPRTVLFPDQVYKQKSIKRFFKFYEIKIDKNPLKLIQLCANTRTHTWIDEGFLRVYKELFEAKILHSLELYEKDELLGGIYGLIIGKMFFGESMVSLKKNISKLAMIKLCELLKPYDFIIDCQIYNPHLHFMGAQNISRKEFLDLLNVKINQNSGFSSFKDLEFLC